MTTLPDRSALETFGDDELSEERDFLLGSLADLEAEREAGDVDDHDYEVLRDGYTARAAAVLRVLDERRVDAERDRRPAPGGDGVRTVARSDRAAGLKERRRKPLIIAIVALFAVVAGLLVAHTAGQRLPGDTLSGSIATTPANATQKLLAQAVSQFQSRDVVGAIKTYDKILGSDPRNVEALAYRGWLLRLAGSQANDQQLIDRGLQSIRQAEQIQPNYPDAHFFAGETLLRDKGQAAAAITEFETYLADNPPSAMIPEVQGELRAARALAATTTTRAP